MQKVTGISQKSLNSLLSEENKSGPLNDITRKTTCGRELCLPMGLCVPISPPQPRAGQPQGTREPPALGTSLGMGQGSAGMWAHDWAQQGRAALSCRPDSAVALLRQGWAGTVKAAGSPRATTICTPSASTVNKEIFGLNFPSFTAT